jgi:lipid-binding SYLF domain-containing protein
MRNRLIIAALALTASFSGNVQAQAFGNEAGQQMAQPGKPAATPAQKRAAIDKMAKDTLAELFKTKPEVKAEIAKSSGYAVFSEAGVMVLFAGGSGGSGVAVNVNAVPHKHRTYMNVAQASVGIGAGVKDVRTVFVFKTGQALEQFVNKGWEASGQAGAAATGADKGGAVSADQSFVNADTVSMYQLTPTGLIAEATVAGKKFWKSDLNKK